MPVYDVCKTAPATYGCSVVIKEHDAITACIANPKAPGCTTTLPPLDQCRADGSAYGCVAVLARASNLTPDGQAPQAGSDPMGPTPGFGAPAPLVQLLGDSTEERTLQ